MRNALIVLAACGLSIAPAFAQDQEGLVNVTISDNEVLNNLGINAAVPVTVAVPIGIAAQVCPNVSANVIAQSRGSQDAVCDIGSVDQTTTAFNEAVSQRNVITPPAQTGTTEAQPGSETQGLGAGEGSGNNMQNQGTGTNQETQPQ